MYTCICMWRACGIRPQYTLSIKSLQLMVLQKIALWQKYEVQTANTAGRTRFGHLAIASIRLSTHYVNSSLIRCQTNSFEDPIKKLIRAHVFFFFWKGRALFPCYWKGYTSRSNIKFYGDQTIECHFEILERSLVTLLICTFFYGKNLLHLVAQ